MSGGIVFDLYALAFAAGIAGTVGLLLGLRGKLRGPRRPYDWETDGECDNHSHPRIVA